MRFNFGNFGAAKNTTESTPPESTAEQLVPEDQDPKTEEVDTSRRNFIIGAAATVAGSTLLGEDAEAARRAGESNRDYRDRSLRELREHRDRESRERIRDSRYGTRPSQTPERAPRVETKGAMTYIGFNPTEHEQKLLGIRLYRLVPNAESIQISLHTSREYGTQNLQMNVLRENGTSFTVVGAPVFVEPNQNQNMLLINRLLERLAEPK